MAHFCQRLWPAGLVPPPPGDRASRLNPISGTHLGQEWTLTPPLVTDASVSLFYYKAAKGPERQQQQQQQCAVRRQGEKGEKVEGGKQLIGSGTAGCLRPGLGEKSWSLLLRLRLFHLAATRRKRRVRLPRTRAETEFKEASARPA